MKQRKVKQKNYNVATRNIKRFQWNLTIKKNNLEQLWRNQDTIPNSKTKEYNKHILYEKIELLKMKINYIRIKANGGEIYD